MKEHHQRILFARIDSDGAKQRHSIIELETNHELPDAHSWALHYEFVRGADLGGNHKGTADGMMVSDSFLINDQMPVWVFLRCLFDLRAVVVTKSGDNEADSRYYSLARLPQPWFFVAYGEVNQQTGRYHPLEQNGEGCYADTLFVVSVGNQELEEFRDFENDTLISKEYPHLIGGENHEEWNTLP